MKPAPIPQDYTTFLAQLKQRVVAARVHAARAVNYDLVLLYWDIGQGIVEKQKNAAWGDAVVERLAKDLQRAFPEMSGLSVANVWRMRQFYETYSGTEFLAQAARELNGISPKTVASQKLSQAVTVFDTMKVVAKKAAANLRQAVAETGDAAGSVGAELPGPAVPEILAQAVRELAASVPWGHHIFLMGRIKEERSLFYYLRATAKLGWSRSVLLNQIKAGAFERAVKEKKTHNFELALPEHFAEQADEMLKSRNNLEFLGIGCAMKERELENRLIERLQSFILELGYGFCFVGRQYRLALGRKEYFVDLLFYHRFLKALVAFDLKLGPFEPEHAGKMDFYLNLLNETERAPDDRPSIGIILCAEKDDIEVEFALKTKQNPIGVAEYELQAKLPAEFKGRLPTAKQLAEVLREALP